MGGGGGRGWGGGGVKRCHSGITFLESKHREKEGYKYEACHTEK